MGAYFSTLLLAGAVTALASLLLPPGNERLTHTVELGLSLAVLLVLLRPLSALPDAIGDLSDLLTPPDLSYGERYDELPEATKETVARGIAEGIESDIAARYSIPLSCVSAMPRLAYADGELTIAALDLTFSGVGATLDLLTVRDYAERAYQTDCEVRIDGG